MAERQSSGVPATTRWSISGSIASLRATVYIAIVGKPGRGRGARL